MSLLSRGNTISSNSTDVAGGGGEAAPPLSSNEVEDISSQLASALSGTTNLSTSDAREVTSFLSWLIGQHEQQQTQPTTGGTTTSPPQTTQERAAAATQIG